MTKIVKDVKETIMVSPKLSRGALTPVRCRNCKRELAPRADSRILRMTARVNMWEVAYTAVALHPSLIFLPLLLLDIKTISLILLLPSIHPE